MNSNKSNKKIGRNDPCYCGSNIKYKKCHLNRHLEKEITEGDVKGFASKKRVPKACFHSAVDGANCAGKIIEAHTVSKSGSLKKIAKNSKVYHFKPDINALFENNGKFILREIGIGQASTFPGFCEYHDKSLFSPIENKPFEANIYNATLLAYRAISLEIYAKQHQSAGIPFLKKMDQGKPELLQIFLQDFVSQQQEGINYGLRDLLKIKESFNNAFKLDNFTPVKFVAIKFTETPHLLFSGSIYPQYDFTGKLLQDLGSQDVLDGISINAIATPTGGAIVFHWFGQSSANESFIRSLLALPTNALVNAITQFAFEFLENLFISPTWWDTLDQALKKNLEERVMNAMSHTQNCLIPDGKNYFLWSNPEIIQNITQ